MKNNLLSWTLVTGLALLFGCQTTAPNQDQAQKQTGDYQQCDSTCGRNGSKTLICHVPPGNPGNAHNICISDNAVAAHLEHGDYCGECEVEEDCPPQTYCGDNTCNENENCESCAEDCGICDYCGDQQCNGDEDCETCASDCGRCEVCDPCGNQTCDEGEDCESCPSDCGVCQYCGDESCNGEESCSTCATDCGECPPECGDQACEGDENCETCPSDCGECSEENPPPSEVPPSTPSTPSTTPPAKKQSGYDVEGGQYAGCNSGGDYSVLGLFFVLLSLLLLSKGKNMLKLLASLAIIFSMLGTAQAQIVVPGAPADANLERFQLPMDRDGVVNVEGGEVSDKPLTWGLHLWLGYSNDPLTVSRDGDRVGALVGDRVGAAVGGYLVLLPDLALGLEVPVVVGQTDDSGSLANSTISTEGFGDLRVMAKYQLLSGWANVALGTNLTLPTNSNNSYIGERTVTFNPYLAITKNLGSWTAAANLGYHVRPVTQIGNLTLNDELVGRLGLGYDFNERHNLAASVTSIPNARDFFDSDNRVYSEGMAAYTYSPDKEVDLVVGTGMGLNQGYGAPDWRGFVAIRFTSSPEAPQKLVVEEPPPAAEPPAPAPVPEKATVALHVPVVYFKFDKSDILPGYAAVLDQFAEDVNKLISLYPDASITVVSEGNTDSKGSGQYNVALGQRRADAVASYLRNAGVPAQNITVGTRGEDSPIKSNGDQVGRSFNRRTTIRVENLCDGCATLIEVNVAPGKQMLDGLRPR